MAGNASGKTEAVSKGYVDDADKSNYDVLNGKITDLGKIASKAVLVDGTATIIQPLSYSSTVAVSDNVHLTNKKYVDDADLLKADKLTTYTKSEVDTFLGNKKTTGTYDDRIQHSSANAGINCSGANQIDLKVNGANRGYIF